MKKFQKYLLNFAWGLLIAILVLLPWHTTLMTVLLDGFGLREFESLSSLIPFYKEALLLLMGLVASFFFVKDKLWKKQKWTVYVLGFVFVMGLISLLQPDFSISRFFVGGRFEFGYVVAIFSAGILVPYFSDKMRNLLWKVVLGNLVLVLVWGFLWQIVGYENLTLLGFRQDWSTSYLGEAPAFCQREAGTSFCRMQATFAGPNRFAVYLLALLPLLYVFMKKSSLKKILQVLIGVALVLTLSSGAWLALLIGGVLCVFFGKEYYKKVPKVSYVVFGGVIALVTYLMWPMLVESSLHFTYLDEGLRHFANNLLGSGVWASGPATIALGRRFVPESWFVQVLINGGVAGGLMFAAMIFMVLKRHVLHCGNKVQGAFVAAMFFVLSHNLFLHTLEVPAAYWALGLLFGLAEYEREKSIISRPH